MQEAQRHTLKLAEPASPAPKLDPFGDEEGTLVLRCPGMSAEDKLAWALLRHRSGWGNGGEWDWGDRKFKVTAQEIAEHQHVDGASGRRRRANLSTRWKLIEVHHRCNVSGAWTVSLVRPSEALAEHLGLTAGDGQQLLPGVHDHDSLADEATSEREHDDALDAPASSAQTRGSAEPLTEPPTPHFSVTAEPPLARAPSGHQNTSVVLNLSNDIDIGQPSVHTERLSTAKDQAGSRRGGTVDATAGREPRRANDVGPASDSDAGEDEAELHALFRQRQTEARADQEREQQRLDLGLVAATAATLVRRLPDERSQSMARERWITTIRRVVDDPALKLTPCVKVACAIVEGRLKESIVEEIFAELRQHRQRGTFTSSAGAYFVGSAKKAFHRLGLDWHAPPRKPK
jgi:hypothetical protein